MKQVRCISPHGGCHNGQFHDGHPVHPVWDGEKWVLPPLEEAKLRQPPNPGGYIDDARIGTCAVGRDYEVPDGFYADGFHWSELDGSGSETGATKDKAADIEPDKNPQVTTTGIQDNPSDNDPGAAGQEA